MTCIETQAHLHDYLDDALPLHQRTALEQHLTSCAVCAKELERLHLLLRGAATLPREREPQRDLWPEIAERIRTGSGEHPPVVAQRFPNIPTPLSLNKPRASHWQGRAFAVAATFLLMVGAFWYAQDRNAPSWNVAALQGTPLIDSRKLQESGALALGETLQTDHASRARLEVDVIGHVDVEPNTRLRFLTSSLLEHRLALDEGTIHATIAAPPRLFMVETPSAVAVDLGCVYTLTVERDGGSLLYVTSGWVALEFGERESIVPAGTMCRTRTGFGPGTPFLEDASELLQRALVEYDFEWGHSKALRVVLREARPMDSITLWHLLIRTSDDERAAVYDRLTELVPPPSHVTREGVLGGDLTMLKRWQKHLNLGMKPWWKFWQ